MKQKQIKEASDAYKKDEPKTPYKRCWGNQFSKLYTESEIEKLADEMYEWFGRKENFWLKDFANERMINRQRISEFVSKNSYFAWIYEICQDMQESKVVRLGLNKKFNPALPILMLKNNHKWQDRQDVSISGNADGVQFVE